VSGRRRTKRLNKSKVYIIVMDISRKGNTRVIRALPSKQIDKPINHKSVKLKNFLASRTDKLSKLLLEDSI